MNDTHQRRILALQSALDGAGIACAVLSRAQHLTYYAGQQLGGLPLLLLVSPRRCALVAPAGMGESGFETFPYTSYDIHNGWSVADASAAALGQALSALCPPQAVRENRAVLGLEVPFLPANLLQAALAYSGEQRELAGLLWGLRKIRDAGELEQIRLNQAGNDLAFARLRDQIQAVGETRAGVSEFELWATMYRTLCETAGEPVALQADLGVGLRGVVGDAKPGPFQLEAGDAVFADLYTSVRGYTADTTRTFIAGQATPRQREVHTALLEALAAGEARLRPGERACDVDAAVRGCIARSGFGANFPHHSGHASGLFHQDRPYFIPADPTPLEAGMVVTLEPGIYIPAWGGMRLEHNYLIEPSGPPLILDQYPLDL